MNSRQINFYLTSRDLLGLENQLRTKTEFLIVESVTRQARPEILDSLAIRNPEQDRLKICLVQRTKLDEIRLRDVPGQELKFVDELRSPVVEFIRCYETKKKIRAGRLYFVSRYFDPDGHLVSKDSGFVQWADGLLNLAKRRLRKDESSIYYYGQEAYDLRQTNVEFLI